MKNLQVSAIASIKEKFLPALQNSFGDGLISVILYGSAAGTEYNPGSSDINLLTLIEKPAPEAIMELGRKYARYIAKKRISLQIQTLEEFLASADVFPMEYLDLAARREILFGRDAAADVKVDKAHLRHQVEERLRGSVNAFRQALLASGGSKRRLKQILIEWFGAQTALLRALLRLKDEEHIPFGADALATFVADSYGIDGSPFTDLSALRDGGEKVPGAVETAPKVLLALTELAAIVDRMAE